MEKVIELGAGTGEHFKHIRHSFNTYILADHDSKAIDIARSKIKDKRCSFMVMNGSKLSFASNTFDRTIATHVLEHIPNPHLAIKEWTRITKAGGVLSILIPTDPGLLWRLSRRLGPRRNAIKQGIAYDYIMAREHVNSCTNLLALLRHYFQNTNESWWPLSIIRSVDMNLFVALNIIKDK